MPKYVCPTCGQETSVATREEATFRPFCCKRCQLIDLHHWFEGDYCISDSLLTDPDAADRNDLPPDDKSI